jgi:NADH-quinone oxidoreductase subunit L
MSLLENEALWVLALLAVPLAAALTIAFFFRRSGGFASFLSVGAAVLIAAIAGHVIFRSSGDITARVPWLELGDLRLSLGFLVNDLAKLMLVVVAFVGLLIHVFSLGYMKEDPSKARFFGAMSLFMFSMLGLTVAQDLVMLFIFWELVGVSSYLLIGFYLEKPSAVAASNKAFIVNRIGDFGFVIGIAWAYWHFGTVDLAEIAARLGAGEMLPLTGVALLLFCGAVGKSGQMPLHVWLPDAMEGPTPVSALIHAATMVAAGIYLLCRISVMMTVDALTVVLAVGVTTALFAGFCAVAQKDIKKILAYSTVSQLGYMVAAFALGSKYTLMEGGDLTRTAITAGVAAAMFHLTTHAFFKALLFLGAGSVIHGCHHEQNIFRMGGLAKRMPLTFACFTLGYLALIGTPFFSGFFSKDAILLLAYQTSAPVFWLLAFGALLTALYMTRLWLIAFFGRAKSDHAAVAHESPLVMTVPLMVLAVLAVVGGVTAWYPAAASGVLEFVPHAEGAAHTMVVSVSVAVFLLGGVSAFLFYKPGAAEDHLEKNFRPAFKFLGARLWFDEIYGFYVAKIQERFAQLLSFLEHLFISGLFVRGSAAAAGLIGIFARGAHSGNIHSYAYWFFAGLVALWLMAFGF